ncbi:MAG: N-acetylneuraminate synthase family protein [Solirubrobacteraceae bacterium]
MYLVAEIGSNHNHDLGLARELISVAADAGVDAVKFQLFRTDALYPPHAGAVETPMGTADLREMFEAVELPYEWLHELHDAARQTGIAFVCAPFDEATLRELAKLDMPAIKIASPELNHLPLVRAAARLHHPLICSTGLSTIGDIAEAIVTIEDEWPEPEVVLLQCASAYPLPPEQANLGVIETLRRTFGVHAGLSDHTMEAERIPAVAVAMGAAVIEKHFTLDRALPGPDHPISLEPGELRRMVATIRTLEPLGSAQRLAWVQSRFGDVSEIVGDGRKTIVAAERPLYPNDKRSIHAIVDIAAGDKLGPDNIRVLRSERNLSPGLHPRHWDTVRGARTTHAVMAGEGVQWEHLLQRKLAP